MSSRYNFTERVRATLGRAREHAVALDHEYVGTEHILLGLLESEGVGATALRYMNVDLAQAAELVMSTVKRRPPEPTRGPDAPYTARSRRVLELSMSEADAMNHSYVGTEHLLLFGVALDEGDEVVRAPGAAEVLQGLVVDR